MKRLYTILSLIICTLSVYSQNNVFVLVDVSKSITQADINNGKQALTEVLLGSALSKAFVSQGNPTDLVNFKLAQGDKLSVSKFGGLQTTLAINPTQIQIQNVGADVSQVLNSIPLTPTDNQTYLTLAKAKIAEYAKNHNIAKYKLYVISDGVNDDYGQNGKPNYPDDYTRNLAESYNTTANPVNEQASTRIKFSNTSTYAITFIPSVDVSKYSLPGGTPPAIVDTNTENAAITITTPPEAKKGKEHEIKTETVNINWNCPTCPQGIKYTVLVSQYDGGKFRETKKDLVANTATFKLPDGKFRITVSASNYAASSDYTCISVSTGGYGWLIFLLILIVGIAIGYYFWNKKRQEKIDVFASNKADDIFTKSSGGTTSSNSSNSDYF
ncbi:MAG: hypothetical protein LC109_05880 [Bacteroidia bacterium]|nr:hypothetical protein [Bacteroidia bacterium]